MLALADVQDEPPSICRLLGTPSIEVSKKTQSHHSLNAFRQRQRCKVGENGNQSLLKSNLRNATCYPRTILLTVESPGCRSWSHDGPNQIVLIVTENDAALPGKSRINEQFETMDSAQERQELDLNDFLVVQAWEKD